MPGKKVKKNTGNRGRGMKSKYQRKDVKVEKVIELMEMLNSGVNINIVETNTSRASIIGLGRGQSSHGAFFLRALYIKFPFSSH